MTVATTLAHAAIAKLREAAEILEQAHQTDLSVEAEIIVESIIVLEDWIDAQRNHSN